MKLVPFYSAMWESNSYLLVDGTEAILIDAGVNAKDVMDQLQRENAALKQNANAALHAPVRGVKGSAKQKISDFERGFESVM